MKYTRALSFGNLADYEVMNALHFKISPDKPIHRPTQSLLTTTSGFNNFRGLLNWGAFLLFITTSRMALENVLKYGIVMDPTFWLRFILQTPDKFLALGLLACCNVFIFVAWVLETAVARGRLNPSLALLLSCFNLANILLFPTLVICYHDFNPLFSSPVLMVYTILFLKLWSYLAVNRWCRTYQLISSAPGLSHEEFLSQLVKERERLAQMDSLNSHTDLKGSVKPADSTEAPNQSDTGSLDTEQLIRNRRCTSAKPSSRSTEPRTEIRRSRSPQPTTFKPKLNSQTRTRSARASMGSSTEYRNMLDALELEPHGLVPSLECNEIKLLGYVTYPNNLTLEGLYYFMLAPTLCYELNFPRTLSIRTSFVLKRLFEMIFLNQLILCLTQQWMLPTLKNSVAPIAQSDFSQIIERCLKLAIPNHLIWLLFFYSTFHSFLNVVGELTRFGDRFFYSDWWNAESVPAFWSKWNIPVHRFARRHIYLPLIGCGLTRPHAGIVVFLISALLHEFLISVPLKMPRMWAFLCMFSQMPYAMLVNRLFPRGGAWGNVAVWMTLIIGQPLAMLFYFHDYYLAHYVN
ncbi:diacylglycerol O-acyltransferase 1 [Paragonimus westermani]|uniref:O-acyltransferase n=1 Tax=Paragonimus westermani TaxID=34504 RepID=A0A5J4P1U2_9TREM|nr:diacylglycerol O-acyltransferase 1 [Paragonimus westermani]